MHTRLGLFGGTFNPIHIGHLRLAEDVRDHFRLDRVLFIPTNIPPHKNMDKDIAPDHRLDMVRIAIEGNDAFICDDIELRRGGHSYTIDTVDHVYDTYQFRGRPFFILGSDLMPELHTWKNVHRLVQLVHFVVLVRDNYPYAGEGSNGIMNLSYSVFDGRNIQVTSSEIRALLSEGRSARYLVTERVLQYIDDHELYR